jgi:hypothetical protein
MSFKPLGSYEHVRKLWSDAHYLYVLTRNRLDRITLKSIATASLEVVTVATPQALGLPEYTYFSDFGISDKLGVIATSSGLFRVGDCCDITEPSLISAHALNWTKVVMPESDAPVFRLLFISPTHDEGGFAYDGMMYVLSGSVTHNQTRVSRFFVSDVRNQPITDSTIQPLNDLFVKGTLSYLLEFGELKNYIATDGLAILNSHSGNQKCGAVLKAFSGESTSGTGFKTCSRYATPHSNFTVVKEFPLSKSTPKHSTIHRIVRSISGSWIVCGDFGLQMNE